MGASPEEDQPILPVHGGGSSRPEGDTSLPKEDEDAGASCCCCGIAVVIIAAIVTFIWYLVQITMSMEYTVAITGVSGLNPVTDLQQGRGLLNPVFNLTVGIASKSSLYGACIEPHTTIKVSYSYLDLPLAAGDVPDMCVGPRESSDLRPVVASGSNVPVPGFLIDTLANEIRSGEAMFKVKLKTYDNDYQDGWRDMLTRWVPVGDASPRSLYIDDPTAGVA